MTVINNDEIPNTEEQKALSESELLDGIRTKFKQCNGDWSHIREQALKDVQFYNGEQNDPEYERMQRAAGGEPVLKATQLPAIVQQIENEFRSRNVSLAVHPTDEKGTKVLATINQGLIRHIEERSNSKTAYVSAYGITGTLVPGFGFIKLRTDYVSPLSFNQEAIIEEVKDPFKILPDFNAVKSDFSDAQYWFEFDEITKEQFMEMYGDGSCLNQAIWNNQATLVGDGWIRENQVRICKYWFKDKKVKTLVQFEDGTTGTQDKFGENLEHAPLIQTSDAEKAEHLATTPELPIPLIRNQKVINTRQTHETKIKWILTNGCEVLDEGEWHTDDFPFIGYIGRDTYVDGRREIKGVIRDAKDAQKAYNYIFSQIQRKIAASSKSAWIIDAGSVTDPQKKRWETSNSRNYAALYWNSQVGERKFAPPERGDAKEPAIQAMLMYAQKLSDDIKATIGRFNANLGDVNAEQSGIAIQTLAQNGELSNLHFTDNFNLSHKRLGHILLKLIPKIYDTERAQRIIGIDDEPELIYLNKYFERNGQNVKYDMTSEGTYDVVVDTGPTFATRKAEQGESILKFVAAYPQIMPVIADLVADTLDWDVSGAISERIKQFQGATMPWIAGTKDIPKDTPPEVKAMLVKLQAQLSVANQHAQTLQSAYITEKQKNDSHIVTAQGKIAEAKIKAESASELKDKQIFLEQQIHEDKIELERIKAELSHTQHHQAIVIDLHKHHSTV